jgi:hypothetical protein
MLSVPNHVEQDQTAFAYANLFATLSLSQIQRKIHPNSKQFQFPVLLRRMEMFFYKSTPVTIRSSFPKPI